MIAKAQARLCKWCDIFDATGKVDCGGVHCVAKTALEAIVRSDERAAIRQLCLDEASREGTKAKAATKKGHVDTAVIARCSADAFRKIARVLAPPKPKKARKVAA